jgi:phage-related protein
MTKQLSDLMSAHSRQLAEEKPWVWLYEFGVPDGTRYRLTNYSRTIAFGTDSAGAAIEFSPYSIVHGDIEESAEGDLPRMQVQVGNSTLEMMPLLDEWNGLEGQAVIVRLVNVDELENPAAQMRFDGEVSGVKFRQDRIAFEVSAQNLQRARFPTRRFVRAHCNYQYGGAKCGYDLSNAALLAAFPRCLKTEEACEDHGDAEVAAGLARQHPERWGGWISLPRTAKR